MKKESATKLINSIFSKTYFIYEELCCKCGCNSFCGHQDFLNKLLKFRVIYNE